MPQRSMRSLDRPACLALLSTRTIGRLVFTHRALPDVLPVEYRLDGDRVVLRLAVGSSAAIATQDAVVAMEVDDIDATSGSGWCVTVVGRGQVLTDPQNQLRIATSDLRSWAADGRARFFAIATGKVTGQRLTASGT